MANATITKSPQVSSSRVQTTENMTMENDTATIEMTADVVAAYLTNNPVAASDLPGIIQAVHQALTAAAAGPAAATAPVPEPAVPVKKSITPEFLICLEDGRKFKSLKRHLRTKYDMSPDEYRTKWGLPKDYPMVAPSYAEKRSSLARQMGLGQQGRKAKG
jgi:predicted transcriptional regulator